MNITINLTPASVQTAIDRLERYKSFVEEAPMRIAKELALVGFNVAYAILQDHIYTGETESNLRIEDTDNGVKLYTESQAILFFEFGAGAMKGSGHPLASKLGFGPGTYPGKGHWNDPNGWWYPADGNESMDMLLNHGKMDSSGQWWIHTYGNKPYMPFYTASKEMRQKLREVAQKMFKEAENL